MKSINEMKLVFPAKSENEAFSRAAVSVFITPLDPAVNELSEIRTAVSEAVTNAIVHGYRKSHGNIEIIARILENNEIYIRIKDKGCGIENIKQAMEPLFTTAPEEERSGLGFSVMENFMDKLKVSSKPGKGTNVVMRKFLGNNENE